MVVSVSERLEYLRGEIEAERISTEELIELQEYGLRGLIPEHDVTLLEWAGVPEFRGEDETYAGMTIREALEEYPLTSSRFRGDSTGLKELAERLRFPSHYFGYWSQGEIREFWYSHHDNEVLSQSNHEVALRILEGIDSRVRVGTTNGALGTHKFVLIPIIPEGFKWVLLEDKYAAPFAGEVGNLPASKALVKALELLSSYEQYPVLDEDHFYTLEHDSAVESLDMDLSAYIREYVEDELGLEDDSADIAIEDIEGRVSAENVVDWVEREGNGEVHLIDREDVYQAINTLAHVHKFGTFEHSRITGTAIRRCFDPGCRIVSLDGDEDDEGLEDEETGEVEE